MVLTVKKLFFNAKQLELMKEFITNLQENESVDEEIDMRVSSGVW
jgi:hypothetical protein